MTEPTDTGLRGPDLLVAVVNHILQHPETWNQGVYHSRCGTRHCVAGWAQIMGGRDANKDTAHEDAEGLLGLSQGQAAYLFSIFRSLREIRKFAVKFRDGDYVDYDDDDDALPRIPDDVWTVKEFPS